MFLLDTIIEAYCRLTPKENNKRVTQHVLYHTYTLRITCALKA